MKASTVLCLLFVFFWMVSLQGAEKDDQRIHQETNRLLLKRSEEILSQKYELWKQGSGDFAGKHARFVSMYRYQFGLSKSPEEVYTEALNHLMKLRKKMEDLALKIAPKKNYAQFLSDFKDECPQNNQALLSTYQKEIDRAKKFVIRHHLVTVPAYARKVGAKLGNPKSGYVFGYFARPRRVGGKGTFLVIPPSAKESPALRKQRFRSHNYHWAKVVAPHEAIPGHHLQITMALKFRSGVERFFFNPAFVEGWGLYCEQMLAEQGYYKAPKDLFAQMQMQAWRCARVLVDQGMYLGYLSRKEAEDLLTYTVGMEPLAARLEVAKQARRPFYYSGYFTGYKEFLRLRRKAKKVLGKKFSLQWFHDTLLKIGPLPFDIVEKAFLAHLKIEKKR